MIFAHVNYIILGSYGYSVYDILSNFLINFETSSKFITIISYN